MPLCGNVELRLDPDTRLRRERGVLPTRTQRRPRRIGRKLSREFRSSWGRSQRRIDSKTRPRGSSQKVGSGQFRCGPLASLASGQRSLVEDERARATNGINAPRTWRTRRRGVCGRMGIDRCR